MITRELFPGLMTCISSPDTLYNRGIQIREVKKLAEIAKSDENRGGFMGLQVNKNGIISVC